MRESKAMRQSMEKAVRESMENLKLLVPGIILLAPGTSNEGEHGNSEISCSWNK